MKKFKFRAVCLFTMLFAVAQLVWAQSDRHIEYPTYFAPVNGISIAYQEFGERSNPTVLLVMGLGAQLIHWDDALVLQLVEQGFHVVRFDNRDIGMSEKLYKADTPGFMEMIKFQLGWDLGAPYDLSDMGADAMGLMDYLGIEQVHVVGASMGGMIAQVMAYEYPERVLSLTSVMSSSGAPHLPEGTFEVQFRDRDDLSRDEILEQSVVAMKAIYAKESERTHEEWLKIAARGHDRSHYDDGFARQIWAVLQTGDRTELLQDLALPTVVIHGKLDPLLPLAHGEHTAELIPGADLVVWEDFGHFLGVEHHARLVSEIDRIIQSAVATP
ncbi:MAG: alpha/beta hydrolase [Pseudomonadota bacterium]